MSEPTNADRASWAFEALSAFGQATGGPDWQENLGFETAFSDLLADLMHLADQHKLKWSKLLKQGRWHYKEEVAEARLPITEES